VFPSVYKVSRRVCEVGWHFKTQAPAQSIEHGTRNTEDGNPAWVKIRNPSYSEMIGRDEFFEHRYEAARGLASLSTPQPKKLHELPSSLPKHFQLKATHFPACDLLWTRWTAWGSPSKQLVSCF
jgi:hypothetical protein